MVMRFRGGGVGHTSTRAATDTFKNDRDELDAKSQQARKEQAMPLNMEGEEGMDDEMNAEDSDAECSLVEEDEVDEDRLSDSELIDYGYELESESEEKGASEEDDREGGEEDYADY
jgi:hypothetical protein